jgi:hypothetical protein
MEEGMADQSVPRGNRPALPPPPDSHCASDCCDAYPRLHVHGDHDEWNEAVRAALRAERLAVVEEIVAAAHKDRCEPPCLSFVNGRASLDVIAGVDEVGVAGLTEEGSSDAH